MVTPVATDRRRLCMTQTEWGIQHYVQGPSGQRHAVPADRTPGAGTRASPPAAPEPYIAAFGVTRGVGKNLPVIQFEGGEYSVPDDYVGQDVWVRQQDDDEIVIVHVSRDPGPKQPYSHAC